MVLTIPSSNPPPINQNPETMQHTGQVGPRGKTPQNQSTRTGRKGEPPSKILDTDARSCDPNLINSKQTRRKEQNEKMAHWNVHPALSNSWVHDRSERKMAQNV